jgi:hypothetical protein
VTDTTQAPAIAPRARTAVLDDMTAAAIELATLKRRTEKLDRILGIPLWEHLVLFIAAIAACTWAETSRGPLVVALDIFALALTAFAIGRPVWVAYWNINKTEIRKTVREAEFDVKQRVGAAERELLELDRRA